MFLGLCQSSAGITDDLFEIHLALGIERLQVQFLKHQCESRREVQSLHSRVLELISIVASVSQMLYPVHLPIAMVFVDVSWNSLKSGPASNQ